MTTVVRVIDVTKRYRRGSEIVTAVDHVSLELSAGTITALVGPSGSGKTTLLNLIVGGDESDSGSIGGLPASARWSDLAVVPQQLGLLPELTIGENVRLPTRLGTRPALDVDDVMETLLLTALEDRPPEETSLGEQQRAAVARALVSGPSLLVADEPTSHQDGANTARVITALADLAVAGLLVAGAATVHLAGTPADQRHAEQAGHQEVPARPARGGRPRPCRDRRRRLGRALLADGHAVGMSRGRGPPSRFPCLDSPSRCHGREVCRPTLRYRFCHCQKVGT